MKADKKYITNEEFINAYMSKNSRTEFKVVGQIVARKLLETYCGKYIDNIESIDRSFVDLLVNCNNGDTFGIDIKFRMKNSIDFQTMTIDADQFARFQMLHYKGDIEGAFLISSFKNGVVWVSNIFKNYEVEDGYKNDVTIGSPYSNKVLKTSYNYKPIKIYYLAWKRVGNLQFEPVVSEQPINVGKLDYEVAHKSYELF